MVQIAARRSRLEKQPTDLRRSPRDLGDGTLVNNVGYSELIQIPEVPLVLAALGAVLRLARKSHAPYASGCLLRARDSKWSRATWRSAVPRSRGWLGLDKFYACFQDNVILLGQTLVDASGQAVKITERWHGFRVSAVTAPLRELYLKSFLISPASNSARRRESGAPNQMQS